MPAPGKATATSRPVGSNSPRSPRRPAPAGRFQLGQQDRTLELFPRQSSRSRRVAGPARSGRSPPRAVRPGGGRSRRIEQALTARRVRPGSSSRRTPCRPARAWVNRRAGGSAPSRRVQSSDGTPQALAGSGLQVEHDRAAGGRAPREPAAVRGPGGLAAYDADSLHDGGRITEAQERRAATAEPEGGASETAASGPGGTQRPHSRDGPPAPSVTVARLSVRGRQPAWLAKTSVPGAPRLRQLTSDERRCSVGSRWVGDAFLRSAS